MNRALADRRTGDQRILTALLLLAVALVAPGCARRSHREIHATNVYYHHLSGTEVHTHARYD